MSSHWIQTSITHKGAATAAAKRAGLTVHEWCLKHQHDKGVTGHRARLGLTLESLHHHDESNTDEAQFKSDVKSAFKRHA